MVEVVQVYRAGDVVRTRRLDADGSEIEDRVATDREADDLGAFEAALQPTDQQRITVLEDALEEMRERVRAVEVSNQDARKVRDAIAGA